MAQLTPPRIDTEADGSEPPRARTAEPRRRLSSRLKQQLSLLIERNLGLVTLLDQATVSGTRFLIGVALARFAGPADLGIYSLAFAAVIIVVCTQESLVCRPYTVFWRSRHDARRFRGSSLLHHLVLSGFSSAVALVAAAFFYVLNSEVALIAGVLAIVLPSVLLWDFARRNCFAHLQMGTALAIDGFSSAFQLLTIALLAYAGFLSASSALLVVAGGALLTSLAWLALWRKNFLIGYRDSWGDWAHNWRFGRWAFATQLGGSLNGQVPGWLLLYFVGVAATGTFTACENIVLLSNPLLLGLANLLEARSAEKAGTQGQEALASYARKSFIMLTAITSVMAITIFCVADWLLLILFGPDFTHAAGVVRILGIAVIAWGWIVVFAGTLAALGRPDASFKGTVAGLIATILAGIATVPLGGIAGAAVALVIGSYVSGAWQGLSLVAVLSEGRAPCTAATPTT
ncbi:lipopolysaccharide biosynthesis protein [Stratiformator vulcanicus]|uniref:MurJ-like flippase n=1 Tax=Stratiformator vulcanicus TaxID=2527980 RepID=A0A517QWG0_9PLAN|nr:lipopolysaccharide biosynthesis protein [Stratiformator vulcanicus]QDT35910.1 MurJ-like flippase [Stratiformator vulcanicus]